MIYYGIENKDNSALAWETQFGSTGPGPGHGDPVGEYSPPLARRETGQLNGYADIDFYGMRFLLQIVFTLR